MTDNRESDKMVLRRVITDVFCLAVVGVPILLYKLFGVPYKRGFFCNDESISHPYKNNTISSLSLYFIGFGCPVVIFIITEYWRTARQTDKRDSKTLFGRKIFPWVWECYKLIGVFAFGAACSHFTTDMAKYEIGRLRPHFLDVCRPNVNCSLPANQHVYIEEFECTNPESSASRLRDARLSFLSGHSSFAAYTMIFLIMYVQARWQWRGSKLLRHVMQMAAFLLAWYTALSRVSDYKHHWSDVLAGALQGSIVSVLIVLLTQVLFVSELFPRPRTPVSSERESMVKDQSGSLQLNEP